MVRIRTYKPKINFLDSQHVRVKTAGITIDSTCIEMDEEGSKILLAGSLVVKDDTTGLYRTLKAEDSAFEFKVNETFLTVENVDLTYGNALSGAYDMARVIENYLPCEIPENAKKAMPFILFI